MLEGTVLDLGLHAVTVTVAAALTLVSLRAYERERSPRFAFICGGFGLFALKELTILVNIFYLALPELTWIAHALNLGILGLFFYGVTR